MEHVPPLFSLLDTTTCDLKYFYPNFQTAFPLAAKELDTSLMLQHKALTD